MNQAIQCLAIIDGEQLGQNLGQTNKQSDKQGQILSISATKNVFESTNSAKITQNMFLFTLKRIQNFPHKVLLGKIHFRCTFQLMFINYVIQIGGGGVSQKMTRDDKGGGGGLEHPKKDDVIYEQTLKDFRTHLTPTSSRISSTYSSEKTS